MFDMAEAATNMGNSFLIISFAYKHGVASVQIVHNSLIRDFMKHYCLLLYLPFVVRTLKENECFFEYRLTKFSKNSIKKYTTLEMYI